MERKGFKKTSSSILRPPSWATVGYKGLKVFSVDVIVPTNRRHEYDNEQLYDYLIILPYVRRDLFMMS